PPGRPQDSLLNRARAAIRPLAATRCRRHKLDRETQLALLAHAPAPPRKSRQSFSTVPDPSNSIQCPNSEFARITRIRTVPACAIATAKQLAATTEYQCAARDH